MATMTTLAEALEEAVGGSEYNDILGNGLLIEQIMDRLLITLFSVRWMEGWWTASVRYRDIKRAITVSGEPSLNKTLHAIVDLTDDRLSTKSAD